MIFFALMPSGTRTPTRISRSPKVLDILGSQCIISAYRCCSSLCLLHCIPAHSRSEGAGLASRDGSIGHHWGYRRYRWAILVLSGSGLNPFVSIVDLNGSMLFLLEPIKFLANFAAPTALGVALRRTTFRRCLNAVSSMYKHSHDVPTWIPRQEGVRDVVQTMTNIVVHADGRQYLWYLFDL